MIDLSRFWAVVQMERRHTRRLVRYWVFLSIAYLFGLLAYLYYSGLHAFLSSLSASVGMIGPRYLMGAIGLYYLTGFVLGIVFLGFDVRARDIREGIGEVLDARPLTNLELVGGRFVALFLSSWIPIVVLVLIIQGLGWLLPLLGSPLGRTVEPLSLFNFVFYMSVPAIAFAIGLVFLVTLLVRHRLVAALLTVGAVIGLYWVLFTIPGPYIPYLDYLGTAQTAFPSDIVPSISVGGGFLQRLGFLIFALGLVGFAAVIHPRLDGQSKLRPAAISAGLVVVGFACVALVSQRWVGEARTLEQWAAAHEARAGEPIADIVSIDGTVALDPGTDMEVALTIGVQAPPDERLDRVLLTLNPGFNLGAVSLANGTALSASHVDGLLDIELERSLAPGEAATLSLQYSGAPHMGFGYLDSALVVEEMTLNEAQVVLLGYERGIFDRRYVALTPGIRWLPASGVDVGREDPRQRATDYFTLTLEVEVPADWLAAGPGKRAVLDASAGRARFRFAPAAAVPEAALMASRFERYATEIRGITFEVLVHPEHTQNFEVLADARQEIEQWVAERLDAAAGAGLAYPFDGFTIVEVPNTLRAFEGGWRLDSALAPPGMMLLRETSFPTARFDVDAVAIFGNRNYDQEGGAARIDRNRLVNFFSNDFSGGNLFAAAARSFFAHRTSAVGPEAIALDYTLEELSTLMISGRRSYFSAHMFTNVNQAVTSIVTSLQGQGITSIGDAVVEGRTNQTDVWNTVLQVPLTNIDPWDDPQRTIDMLALKGGELAEAIRDTLGADAVVELLAVMLERHAGQSYTLDDLIAAGDSVSPELGPLLRDWTQGTGLPGFVVRGVEQYRLPDDDNGDARYQLLVRVSNDEPVIGFLRLGWQVAGNAAPGINAVAVAGVANVDVRVATASSTSDPIRIPGRSAIELGVVLNQPAVRVNVQPYLSRNRTSFVAGELNTGSIPDRDAAPFDGIRQIPFEFETGERIVADDLDPTFTIVTETGEDSLRLAARETIVTGLDQGLPVATNAAPRQWSRRSLQTAWGQYRHTFAYVRAGDGLTRAVMPATIPEAGSWELELHVPTYFIGSHGTWNLDIVSAAGRESVTYDASIAVPGWNLVGRFSLPAGEVTVEVSDRTDGRIVIADAVAWQPVGNGLTRPNTE